MIKSKTPYLGCHECGAQQGASRRLARLSPAPCVVHGVTVFVREPGTGELSTNGLLGHY